MSERNNIWIESIGISLRGKRKRNEDSILIEVISDEIFLLAVADGMGGGVMGKEVSTLTIETLMETLEEELSSPEEIESSLIQAVLNANERVLKFLKGKKGGTTLTVACISLHTQKLYYINVGDSRLQLFRNGQKVFQTIDQNRYERLRLSGLPASLEDKRFLTYAIGTSSSEQLKKLFENKTWKAVGNIDTQPKDFFLLSTDGFHDYIEVDKEIRKITSEENISLCKFVKELAETAEIVSKDNVSLIGVRIKCSHS